MSLMLKSMRITGFTLLITGAVMLSVFLAPFSVSQNPVDEVNGTPAGWSDNFNLSNDPALRDNLPEIAVNGDNIHVVWLHNYEDIYYSKSIDCGKSWSTPKNLFHWYMIDYPYIGVSGNIVHVVWSGREIAGINRVMYCNSTDNGETWNPPKEIFNATGFEAYCWGIYVNNSNIHIISEDMRDGSNGEIYYRRSIDGGITFDNGQGVDQDRRITLGLTVKTRMRINGDGSNISIAWSDERDGDWEIYWMTSKDNGYSWEDGIGLPNEGRKLSDNTYDDIYPSIAVNGTNIHIAWIGMSWPGPEYRLYYRNSTDKGATWNSPIILAGPSSGLTYPDIDVVGNNIYLVWDDEKDDGVHHEIYIKNSTDGGITWSGDLRLTYNSTTDSFHPKIIVKNDTLHIVWDVAFPSSDREIYYKRSPDFPDTSPPSHSNEIPYPDSYKDAPGTNVSVHVTDPSGVNESTTQLYVNGSLVSHTLTPITDGYNVSWDSPGFEPGVVTCRIVADDNLSNHLDYTWNFTVLALYGIQLHEGWNLISVPFVQVNTSIKEVLKDIDGKWDFIEYYDAGSGAWKSYATFWPESLNEFQEINNTMALWINITEPDVNLTVRGLISTYTEIPLKAGWNFVGYPTQTTETVANALWGTGADRVEVFDPTDPYRLKEVGSTYVMKPGEGYWVHVVADTVWFVGW